MDFEKIKSNLLAALGQLMVLRLIVTSPSEKVADLPALYVLLAALMAPWACLFVLVLGFLFFMRTHGDGVEDLTALADQLGRCCLVHTCDITDTEAVVEMVQAAESAMGKIDILINAAGMNAPKMLEDMDISDDSENGGGEEE